MEEVVQIAVRREGRTLAGIVAAGDNREELGQLPGAAGEGPGEEDSAEQVPNQALGQELVVVRPREWQGHLVPEELLAVRGPSGPPQQY